MVYMSNIAYDEFTVDDYISQAAALLLASVNFTPSAKCQTYARTPLRYQFGLHLILKVYDTTS